MVLMFGHIHAPAPKTHAFHFEARPLLEAGFVFELDLASRADHPLPRQGVAGAVQELGYVAMIQRITGGRRHLAVSGYLAFGNLTDGLAKGGVAPGALGRPPQTPLDFFASHSLAPHPTSL